MMTSSDAPGTAFVLQLLGSFQLKSPPAPVQITGEGLKPSEAGVQRYSRNSNCGRTGRRFRNDRLFLGGSQDIGLSSQMVLALPA